MTARIILYLTLACAPLPPAVVQTYWIVSDWLEPQQESYWYSDLPSVELGR